MFEMRMTSRAEAQAKLSALGNSLALIEFEPNGTILWANDNFCRTLGYHFAEIRGQHHRIFVSPDFALKPEYSAFWAKLARGENDAREYKRIAKGGREIWLQASYNPIVDPSGKVVKIIKAASDITSEKLAAIEFEEKIKAISRVQGIIEFTKNGEVITANQNFLDVIGYRIDEIKGQHHRMFVESTYSKTLEYQEFWKKLNAGEYIAAEFKRVGKGGREVWIQASYNPIFDMNGCVFKIVKFATDVTGQVRSINEIGAGLARLADGNLQQGIEKAFSPPFDSLRKNFNHSLEKLRTALIQVSSTTESLQAGAREISVASDDLSRRTEQNAASLEETAAALDEITATVKRSAEGTSNARQIVTDADNDAKNSAIIVHQAIDAMNTISKSAQQINQIIGVIDEIAFQTNLLALNAGVEAARAGDAGRGFAVVASEVRALAQRSAEAAKEIKGLISASSTHVERGVSLVAQTGQALQRIVSQVGEINVVVVSIAEGAKQQASALDEVNRAVNQMDQVTQQNAAMVEESTAASHSLRQEAENLGFLVSQFELGQAQISPLAERAGVRQPIQSATTGNVPPRPCVTMTKVRVLENG